MIKHEIKNRWSGKVQFTSEIDCPDDSSLSFKVGLSVLWAVKNNANLQGADLQGARLWRADLQGVNLWGANLSRAMLWGAYLQGANLQRANLRDADLWNADLQGANLRDANLWNAQLSHAYLQGANLQRANLQRANLWRANLSRANLQDAKLQDAKNAIVPVPISMVGEYFRTGYTTWSEEKQDVIVMLGCFSGTEQEAVDAVSAKYGSDSGYVAMIKAACLVARERKVLNPTVEYQK